LIGPERDGFILAAIGRIEVGWQRPRKSREKARMTPRRDELLRDSSFARRVA
jgi:hypothetical protein